MTIMEDNRAEQVEALETFVEFNDKVTQNIRILVKELSGARLEDTDVFLESIINSINWEIQVINGTMGVLNEGSVRVEKDHINDKIIALGEAVQSKEDGKIAGAFENLLPMLETVGSAAKEVLAQ